MSDKEICSECGKEVQTMAFKNTGVCSENCRKDRDHDHEIARALGSPPVPSMIRVGKTGRVPRVQG